MSQNDVELRRRIIVDRDLAFLGQVIAKSCMLILAMAFGLGLAIGLLLGGTLL